MPNLFEDNLAAPEANDYRDALARKQADEDAAQLDLLKGGMGRLRDRWNRDSSSASDTINGLTGNTPVDPAEELAAHGHALDQAAAPSDAPRDDYDFRSPNELKTAESLKDNAHGDANMRLYEQYLSQLKGDQDQAIGDINSSHNITGTLSEEPPAPQDPTAGLAPLMSMMKGSGGAGVSRGPAGTQSSKVMDLDVGGVKADPAAGLQHAQENAAQGQFANELGRAADVAGAAIAGVHPHGQDNFNHQIAAAQDIIKNHKDTQEQDKNNPTSPMSMAFRKFMERFGVKPSEGFTAAMGEKIMPLAMKAFEAEENRKSRELTARMHAENLAQHRADQAQTHKDSMDFRKHQFYMGQASKLSKSLEADVASGRSAFGIAAKTHQAADKILKMVEGRDLNGLDQREVAELARNLDTVLSNGSPTVAGAKKLIPSSYHGDVNAYLEKLSNQKRGAQLGSFVKSMLNTVTREKQLAETQIGATQSRILGANTLLPSEYLDPILSQYGGSSGNTPTQSLKHAVPGIPQSNNKPQQINQGGHIYNLNPATGEYE